MSCPPPFDQRTEKSVIRECIHLVKSVSYFGDQVGFPDNRIEASVDYIYDLEGRDPDGKGNWWRTWYRGTPGNIDVVAFFQRMKKEGKYAMCIGFNGDALPDPEDPDSPRSYRDYLDGISADNETNIGLYNFTASCMGKSRFFIVKINNDSDWAHPVHDAKRDFLLNQAMVHYGTNPGHDDWRMKAEKPIRQRFWGSDNQFPGSLIKLQRK